MKLKVPVYAEPIVNNYEQYIKILRDGKVELLKAPMKPYFYGDFDIASDEFPENVADLFINPTKTELQLRPSHKGAAETWYKYEFESEIAIKYLQKQIREASQRSDPQADNLRKIFSASAMRTANMQTRYVDTILTEQPDWFKQFPTENLKSMVLDIEQWSRDGETFEETTRNPLISIKMECWTGDKVENIYVDTPYNDGNVNDEAIVKAFVTAVKDFDPDVFVGFNICGYDIPTLCKRMAAHGYDTKLLDRFRNKEPWFRKQKIGVSDLDVVDIGGRIVYDVMHSVMADQTLNGQVKNRRLKTISKYFQNKGIIPKEVMIVEEDMNDNTALIGTEKLKLYNESDVTITRYLYNMYVKNNIAVAEFIGCPLKNVVPLATSYPFTLICQQIFHEQGIISNGKNMDRNYDAFNCGTKPYQGADVACFRTGRFAPLFEYDVGSLYPSIMASLGLGPDNTKVLKTIPWKTQQTGTQFQVVAEEFRVVKLGRKVMYYVPDAIRKWTWVIEVVGYSKVAEKIREFLKTRFELKVLSGTIKDYTDAIAKGHDTWEHEEKLQELGYAHLIGDLVECKRVESEAYLRAYGLKVVLNSCYGAMGSKANWFGEIGVATLITGVGREILQRGVDFLGESTCILEDTDGIKSMADVDINEMNAATCDYVENTLYGLPLILWEKESFEVIYAKAMKTYLLIDPKGKLVKHGVGFKSSRAPPVFDTIIDKLGYQMLKEGHAKTRSKAAAFYNLKQLAPADFIMQVKMNKRLEDYAENALAKNVAIAHNKLNGTPIKVGQTYEYIKTKDGYMPPTEAAFARIDEKYYSRVIDKAIKALGYDNVFNKTLFDFGL